MFNLNFLKALVGDAEFSAPLSPADLLDLKVGYDDEGWPILETFRVGDRLVSTEGNLYKLVGFTKANSLIVTQSGFNIDPKIRFLEFAGGLRHEQPEYSTSN